MRERRHCTPRLRTAALIVSDFSSLRERIRTLRTRRVRLWPTSSSPRRAATRRMPRRLHISLGWEAMPARSMVTVALRCTTRGAFPFLLSPFRALSLGRVSLSLSPSLFLSFVVYRLQPSSSCSLPSSPSSPSPFFFSSPLQLRRSRCVRCHLLAVDGPRHVARLCRGGRARRQRPAHCRVPKLNARHRSAHETRVGL